MYYKDLVVSPSYLNLLEYIVLHKNHSQINLKKWKEFPDEFVSFFLFLFSVLGKMPPGKMPPGKVPPGNKPPRKIAPRKIAPQENCPLLPLKKVFCKASSCYGIS